MKIKNILIRAWLRINRVPWSGASPDLTGLPLPRFGKAFPGAITLGSRVRLGAGVHLQTYGAGFIRIGNLASVNNGGSITATCGVTLGDCSRCAAGVVILDSAFHAMSPTQQTKRAPVVIGRNVWIGTRVTILAGVTIGDHSVIGAGSVVSRSIPARCFAAGSPARVVSRFECPDDWRRL